MKVLGLMYLVTSLFQRSSTIFAGSCINISVPHLHGVAIEKYYIQTLETFYVLYENDREKYTNVGLEYAARKTWVILCGGNLFHAAVLKVDYSKSSEKFTHSNTLVFSISWPKIS
ncbi:hypothetical protein RF11_10033 [Thelohanellus kitauei]|uniref:Uncharacterized protein n=1 Tax=Thelohanellus kitauei TaxID=669202 RepID=A0A0C2NDB6_THEKT|nr:hypothetical protein RF11_10033 [Thelohanellus kitauei]